MRRSGLSLLAFLGALTSTPQVHAQVVDVTASVRRSVEKVGRELGHTSLLPDARLEAAATALAQHTPDCGPPSRELVEEAMWRSGVLEPVHRLMLVRFSPSEPADMLAELPSRLPQFLGKRGQSGGSGGRWSRFAFGSAPVGSDERCGVVVVLETFVTFAAAPSKLALGATASYVFRLQSPYRKPRALVSPPTGRGDVTPLPIISDEKDRQRFDFTCAAPGRFQLELLAEDAAGPSVLAKFPCDCAVEPPSLTRFSVAANSTAGPHAPSFKSIAEAEQQMLELINAERARAGRAVLVLDERLSAVARAHSEDMHRNQYVAHISPGSGSPGDRVRRAGIVIVRLTENLVKAADPRSAHRELMESPGHRASILDAQARTVGIGAAMTTSPSGEPWLLVTELFAVLAPPKP